jgi:hypothetical protein
MTPLMSRFMPRATGRRERGQAMAAMQSVLEREVYLQSVLLKGTPVFSSLAHTNGA